METIFDKPLDKQVASNTQAIADLNSQITQITNNFYVGNAISIDVDISSAGDKYQDFTLSSAPSGYTWVGAFALCTSYRAYARGVGGDRLYYTVVSPASRVNFTVFPICRKN